MGKKLDVVSIEYILPRPPTPIFLSVCYCYLYNLFCLSSIQIDLLISVVQLLFMSSCNASVLLLKTSKY